MAAAIENKPLPLISNATLSAAVRPPLGRRTSSFNFFWISVDT